MERPPDLVGLALGIQTLSDRQGVRIRLDHRMEKRIQARDLIEIICRQLRAGQRPGIHERLQLRNRRLDPAPRRDRLSRPRHEGRQPSRQKSRAPRQRRPHERPSCHPVFFTLRIVARLALFHERMLGNSRQIDKQNWRFSPRRISPPGPSSILHLRFVSRVASVLAPMTSVTPPAPEHFRSGLVERRQTNEDNAQ